MGSCVTKPESCVGVDGLRTRWKRRGIKKRKSTETINEIHDFEGCDPPADSNPACQAVSGSIDECSFDTTGKMESNCDDDFHSDQDDVLPLSGHEVSSVSSLSSFKEANHEEVRVNTPTASSTVQEHKGSKLEGQSAGTTVTCPATQSHTGLTGANASVYYDSEGMKTVNEDSGEGSGILDNCGLLPNNCLPCPTPFVPTDEKWKSLSCSPPNLRRKATLKSSFKSKPGEGPYKNMMNCWPKFEPSTVRVRGGNYLRDKRKEFAPNYAVCYLFDVHIGQLVDLPSVDSSSKGSSILIAYVPIPLQPAAIFQSETDGQGMSFMLCYRCSDNCSKELSSSFQENLLRLIDDKVERVKGFPTDSTAPFQVWLKIREWLKLSGGVVIVDELSLSATERKPMNAYNEESIPSRPLHEFYLDDLLKIMLCYLDEIWVWLVARCVGSIHSEGSNMKEGCRG